MSTHALQLSRQQIDSLEQDVQSPGREGPEDVSDADILAALIVPNTHPADLTRITKVVTDIKTTGEFEFLPTSNSFSNQAQGVRLGDYFDVPNSQKGAYCRSYVQIRKTPKLGMRSSPVGHKRAAEDLDYDQVAGKVAALMHGDSNKPSPSPPNKFQITDNFFDSVM